MPRPALTDLLQEAIRRHREGDLDGADVLYGRVLDADPNQVEALQLRGTLARRRGRPADALALLDAALRLDPEHHVALYNRGLALTDLGRGADAELSLTCALRLRPELAEARLALAKLLLARGAADEAETQAAQVARPEGRLIAGLARAESARALRRAGRPQDAMARLDHIEGGDPSEIAQLYERGHAANEAGLEAEAERCWRLAYSRPGCPPELGVALGTLLLRAGRPAEALGPLARALRAEKSASPLPSPGWLAFVDAVGMLSEVPAELSPLLAAALQRDGLDHQRLERAIRGLVGADPRLSGDSVDAAALDALIAHPLTAPWLSSTLLQHPLWERRLIALRARLLRAALAGDPVPLPLVEAIARQGWNSEHAAAEPPEDRPLIAAIEAGLQRAIATEQPSVLVGNRSLELSLAIKLWAGYRPLDALPDAPNLRAAAPDLYRQQRDERDEERRLAASVPTLGQGLGVDQTTVKVAAQYEDNPYPRLISAQRRAPAPLSAILRSVLPGFQGAPRGPLKVLVAGCGTGQHALIAATRYRDAQVLAVDISRASLGRAARLAAAWKLDNLEFAVADLQQLGADGPRFHVVESVGVLHHLADPARGLAALAEATLPGGLLLLGLYSERGRADVVAARELIARHGWPPTPDGIRAARVSLGRLPADDPARSVVFSTDFASLSGTRDLLFHVCEHRYSPAELGALLDGAGLELLGFQHNRPEAATWYRDRFPDDKAQINLERWDAVEASHPRIFAGMYVFWARKPAS